MKKIIIGTSIGLIVSFLIFIPSWLEAFNMYWGQIETDSKYCQQLNACNDCNFDYACLKNKCPEFGDRCFYIEGNYNILSRFTEKDKPSFFVESLCEKNRQKVTDCQKNLTLTNKLTIFFQGSTIKLALHYTSLFFKIGYFFLLGGYLLNDVTWLIGALILLIPVFFGFSIGVWLKLRNMNK